VARELAPAGARSDPIIHSVGLHSLDLRLLRSRTRASSLATKVQRQALLANFYPPHKAHLRNNIVYHCCKFLQCDSEEPCE
jgi:hypothetical protein